MFNFMRVRESFKNFFEIWYLYFCLYYCIIYDRKDGWIFFGVVFLVKLMVMFISSFVFKVIGC